MVVDEDREKPERTRIIGAVLSAADREAARWSVENNKPIRSETYPFEGSAYNFWPICRDGAPRIAVGVAGSSDHDQWPDDPARYIELVGAYVASSLIAARPPGRSEIDELQKPK